VVGLPPLFTEAWQREWCWAPMRPVWRRTLRRVRRPSGRGSEAMPAGSHLVNSNMQRCSGSTGWHDC
jgi:hypothetical protein